MVGDVTCAWTSCCWRNEASWWRAAWWWCWGDRSTAWGLDGKKWRGPEGSMLTSPSTSISPSESVDSIGNQILKVEGAFLDFIISYPQVGCTVLQRVCTVHDFANMRFMRQTSLAKWGDLKTKIVQERWSASLRKHPAFLGCFKKNLIKLPRQT